MCPQMVRIRITPTWLGLIDCQARFPAPSSERWNDYKHRYDQPAPRR